MNINEEFKKLSDIEGAILLDVRMPNEYAGGHIPGSRNLPLSDIVKAAEYLPDKSAPIFTYCQSGMRSSRAATMLQKLGYTNVTNIGGISNYTGAIEK